MRSQNSAVSALGGSACGRRIQKVLCACARAALLLLTTVYWLLTPSAARAADSLDALITVTNNPVMSNSLSVNSWTRYWTTNPPTSSQFGVTNTPNKNATNMWLAIVNLPFTNNLTFTFPQTNAVRISSRAGATFAVTVTGGWASVAITTNVQTTAYTYRLPLAAEPSPAHATNMANYNIAGLNSYSTTKILDSLLQDPPVTNTQPAGGSLSGTYPNPAVAAAVTNRFVATNDAAYLALFTATNNLQTQTSALQGSTNALNTRVGALETATNTLQTQTTALQAGTNALHTAVTALNTSTAALNTAVGNLQTATNNLDASKLTLGSVPTARFGVSTVPYGSINTNGGAAGQALIWNDTAKIWTNGTPVASATNAVARTEGSQATNTSTTTLGIFGSGVTNQSSGTTNNYYVTGGGVNPCARAYSTNAVTLSAGVFTVLPLENERFDNDTIHDTSSNTSRLTCKSAGVYQISAMLNAGGVAGTKIVAIKFNGGDYIAISSSAAQYLTASTLWQLAVNDYVEMFGYSSAGDTTATTLSYSMEFGMCRVSQ